MFYQLSEKGGDKYEKQDVESNDSFTRFGCTH